jgi:hypothetical protein
MTQGLRLHRKRNEKGWFRKQWVGLLTNRALRKMFARKREGNNMERENYITRSFVFCAVQRIVIG